MGGRTQLIRRVAGAAAIALLFSACQMEMGVGTKLRSNGSGTFTLAFAADKEFIDGLSQNLPNGKPASANGIQDFEDFFAGLSKQGWNVKRTQTPKGDVALTGACGFPNSKGFDRCLGQLSSADSGSGQGIRFKDAGLSFDFGVKRGFFKSHTFFAGHVNLAGGQATNKGLIDQVRAVASQVFTFSVRADLPGSIRIVKGNGTVKNGVAVWQPTIGDVVDLRAESDAYNAPAVAGVGVPVFLLIGVGIWTLVRRRGRRLASAAGDSGFVIPSQTEGVAAAQSGEARVEEPDTLGS